MTIRLGDVARGSDGKAAGYSLALQAARVRAAYQRSYFAPALFSLVPVETDLIGSMAVDSQWRLYYNDAWLTTHSVEENADAPDPRGESSAARSRDAQEGRQASGTTGSGTRPAIARSTTTFSQKAFRCPEIRRCQANMAWRVGTPPRPTTSCSRNRPDRTSAKNRAAAASRLTADRARTASGDSGSCLQTASSEGGTPGVDRLKADLVRREVARRIDETSPYATDVSLAWRRWARATLTPKIDYMATIRHAVRRALRDSTLGRYDRTYRRPHRRQACYGEFIMPSFYQPRPRPGFLIDTSSSMEDSQLARAVSELGGLTRQLGYGAEVVVACCDAAVQT